MTWFDTTTQRIGPEHIMASGALPPGFPAVEIDGTYYWDGGLVSNTPLQYVMDEQKSEADLCVFQADLFNARGTLPASVWQSEAREKEIRFSSRTRFNTDMMRRPHDTSAAARRLYDKLPPEMKSDPDVQALLKGSTDPHITIAHLIYRPAQCEGGSKDSNFRAVPCWIIGRLGKPMPNIPSTIPIGRTAAARPSACRFDLSNR